MPCVALAVAYGVMSVRGTQLPQPNLKTTELVGRQLYEQSVHPARALSPAFRKARQAAIAALPKLDSSKYHFEVISNPAGDGLLIYALAYSNDADKVVLGVHYRVAVSHDGTTVKSVEPLSRSALIVSKRQGILRGATPGPLWTINLISPTPLEPYVYLSLLHHVPIYVGAPDHTIWKVDGTQISTLRNAR
jgi:hypothetical protein